MDPCNRPRICDNPGVTCTFRVVRANTDICGNNASYTERVSANVPGGTAPIGDPRCIRTGKRK